MANPDFIPTTMVGRKLSLILGRRFGQMTGIVGAEIGVCKGTTAQQMLMLFPNMTLYMIDSWVEMSGTDHINRDVTQERADRWYKEAKARTQAMSDRRFLIRKTSAAAAPMFNDNSLDFVYIDADHRYENVKQDIELWWPKIVSGNKGILMGHDYNGRGDRKFGWGVKRAVDEFAAKRPRRRKVRCSKVLVWWIAKW